MYCWVRCLRCVSHLLSGLRSKHVNKPSAGMQEHWKRREAYTPSEEESIASDRNRQRHCRRAVRECENRARAKHNGDVCRTTDALFEA